MQPLAEQAVPVVVPPQHLESVVALVGEYEQRPAARGSSPLASNSLAMLGAGRLKISQVGNKVSVRSAAS